MQPLWKPIWQFLKIINIHFLHNPAIPALHTYPKRIENWDSNRYLYNNVYSSIIDKSQKVEKTQIPQMDEWINKMWYTHTVEYYSVLKRNKILTHAATWMNLEDIVLK